MDLHLGAALLGRFLKKSKENLQKFKNFGSMQVSKSSSGGFWFLRFDKFRVFHTHGFENMIRLGSGLGLDPAVLLCK